MITINGKEYRNLQEQVLENMDGIESLKNKEADTLLATGITAGQVLTADGNGGTEWASAGGGEEAVQAPNPLTSGNVVIGTTGGDRNVATLATGTLGYVLTQGVGAPSWAAPSVEGANVKSTGATSGKVLMADGQGDASWQTVSGGSGDVTASGTLSVGSVIVGLGNKTIQAVSSSVNGRVLTWSNGAVWQDPGIEYEVLG